jgi:hypothetical protein
MTRNYAIERLRKLNNRQYPVLDHRRLPSYLVIQKEVLGRSDTPFLQPEVTTSRLTSWHAGSTNVAENSLRHL